MDEDEYLKLPVEEKCGHKLWKARVSGYEEALKLFNQWDEDDANWKKYNGQIKKFITDSNAVAQEKGLEAALAYVENCRTADRVSAECIDGVVTKCVAAPKTKTKDLAKQIVLMFCEIESYEKVIEELIKGFAHKNPKVVSGCINNMTACLHNFGAKVIKVSPLLKAIIPLLDHRDKSVRDEGKALIVESYRWVGDLMKQQLNGLKPVQLSELETEFANLAGVKAKPERILRSQQQFGGGGAAEGDAGEGEGQADGADDDDAPEVADPFDLIDPVDILDKLPKNFFDLVEEKKWQLRKEALDALLPLSQSPKISTNGDYGDLIRVLKKFIGKDSNVMLVALAVQCLAGLAKGLRAGFKNGATQCLLTVLEKFKEKKSNVVSALIEAADAMYPCLGIEAIQEDCLACLKHKTPSVVTETAKYLARCFANCPPQLITNKKMVKGYISALLECINHSDPGVREGTSEALGTLMKILGEPTLTKLMPDVDPIKFNKVKEYSGKTVLTGKMPKITNEENKSSGAKVVKPRGGAKVVKPRAGAKVSVNKKPSPTPAAEDDYDDDFEVPEPPARKTSSAPVRRGGTAGRGGARVASARPGVTAAVARKKSEDIDIGPPYSNTGNMKNQRFKDEQKLKILKWNFSQPRPEFVDLLKDQMTTSNVNRTLMTQLFHNDFKQHLKALDTLSKYIDADLEALIANLDLILKWATFRFFETNPTVLLKTLEYLNEVFAALADDSYSLHDIEAVSFIPYLVNKVGDPKDQMRNNIRTMFKRLRLVYPVSKLCPYILEGVKAKNAKQRTECLDDVGGMIRDYGINVLQPSPAVSMKEMAKQIADRDTTVRNAALNALTEAYFQTGDKIYKMIGHLPDKDMSMLEERIKRTLKSRPAPGAGPPTQSAPPPQQSVMEIPSTSGLPRPGGNRNIPTAGGLSALRRYQQQLQQPRQPPQQHGSPGHGRDRPMSGAFTLDLDKIELGSMDGSIGGPELVNHNLDAIFNDEPVMLPPTLATRRGYPLSPSSAGGAMPHTAGNEVPLMESSEAHEALDVILSQVFNKDASACISALSQLDEFIKDDEKVALLGSRMDQLLTACYMQYRHVLNNKMRTDNAASNVKEVVRLFQYLTMVLMSTYHHAELTRNASTSALHDLFHVIISILLEPKVEQLADGGQLLRALNVLTVKIIDRSDHTNVSSAIIKLFSDAVANASLNPKFVETVMKCMWKIIRMLPNWMDEEPGALDVDLLLADLHDFLKTYPPAYWKKQESDTPLRTVKTVLHTMVKVRGDAILDHLTQINDPQNSELVAYLRKLLNSGIGKENAANDDIMKNGNKVNSTSSGSSGGGGKIPRFTKSDHDALAEIFKKIGQKELTKQGLKELYNFKQQNPHADLEPFLVKSSDYFRNYIERGLKGIEDDMAGSSNGSSVHSAGRVLTDSTTRSAMDNNSSGGDSVAPHMLYMDRLKKLRAQGGLDRGVVSSSSSGMGSAASSVYRISATSSTVSSSEGYSSHHFMEAETESSSSTLTASSQVSETAPDVDAIRKRLERIKQSAF